jgi:hypothetical protein
MEYIAVPMHSEPRRRRRPPRAGRGPRSLFICARPASTSRLVNLPTVDTQGGSLTGCLVFEAGAFV